MKLSVLLAQYLYQHKTLNLPGLGTFYIDNTVPAPEINDKNFAEFLQHIRFTQKNIQQPDEELISFIRSRTGKIRPLAIADLESFLDDGKLLLNISKPFYLDGIGTLQKDKLGVYHFTNGEVSVEKLEQLIPDKTPDAQPRKKSVFIEDEGHHSARRNTRTILVVALIVVGLVAIVWGGYSLYDRKTGGDTTDTIAQKIPASNNDTAMTLAPDSTSLAADSSRPAENTPANVVAAGSYKFIILHTYSKHRALNRYNQLKGYFLPIQMDTKDSSEFKLYFVLPATPADTLRMKDSLGEWYNCKNVLIEK